MPNICQRIGIEFPLIQAPMAGGITTPELVAAVSNAGALGSLGAAYLNPDEIQRAIRHIKTLTIRSFNVNLFTLGSYERKADLSSVLDIIREFWQELTDESFYISPCHEFSFEEQAKIILEEKVPVFSFTFGIPPLEWIKHFKKQGTYVMGTASSPEEAMQLEEAGVDAIVCQGQEAGGHRPCFSGKDLLFSLHVLLSLAKRKVRTPLIAAGGIMDAQGIKAALFQGAEAVQLGTAFLTTHESGASPVYKKTLLQHLYPTVITKVFTGRPGRAVINHFIELLEGRDIPPFPIQHSLTAPLRRLAAQKNRADLISLWAGQGYPLCKDISAASLVRHLQEQIS
jgi:nitronate monooxygenase